jgi:hypothetical protein
MSDITAAVESAPTMGAVDEIGEQLDQQRSELLKVIDKYRKVCASSPDNLVAALRFASLLALEGFHHEALTIYLRQAGRWPRVFEPKYLLATTLGTSDTWLWRELTPEAIDALAPLADIPGLERLHEAITEPTPESIKVCLAYAESIWPTVEKHVDYRTSIARWLGSFLRPRRYREEHDWSYQRQFVGVRNAVRERVRAVRLAALCTKIQLQAPTSLPPTASADDLESLRHEVARHRRGAAKSSGICSYNAACCYSRLYELSNDHRDLVAALEQFGAALALDPTTAVSAQSDTDLGPLFRSMTFKIAAGQLDARDAKDGLQWVISLASALQAFWKNWERVAIGRPWEEHRATDDQLFDALLVWVEHASAGSPEPGSFVDLAARLHLRADEPSPGVRLTEEEIRHHLPRLETARLDLEERGLAREARWRIAKDQFNKLRADRREQPSPENVKSAT